MISPWTIYGQKKNRSHEESPNLSISKKCKGRKNGQYIDLNILYQKEKQLKLQKIENSQLELYGTIRNDQSLSSSFLSHLQSSFQNNKHQSHSLSNQIDRKRSQLLKNIDSLSFLKGLTMSLQNQDQNMQQSQTKFYPKRKFSLQNNPELSAQKRFLQKVFNIEESVNYNLNQTQKYSTKDLQKVDSELLAQKFIYKGQKLSLQKKYKPKQSINGLQNSDKNVIQKVFIKNSKSKRRENKFFHQVGQYGENKNMKDLIYQILKRHINFNKQYKQPRQCNQKTSNHQKKTGTMDASQNITIETNILLDQKFSKIKNRDRLSNQNKTMDLLENNQNNFKSVRQLFNLKQICFLKRNRKTLSYAEEKLNKNILKYSELKSQSKINKSELNKTENQKSKKIKVKLKKLQPSDIFFSKIPPIHKEGQNKQSSISFNLNQMNFTQMKFNDQKIFSQIKYSIKHQNPKKILQS